MFMNTIDIIKNNLEFLMVDYGFSFDYKSNGKEIWCCFTNKFGSINWYSYEQFGEYSLSIIVNGCGRKVLDSFNNENNLLSIDKKSFFKKVFSDQRISYWKHISNIFKRQIINTGSLWGLRVIRKN